MNPTSAGVWLGTRWDTVSSFSFSVPLPFPSQACLKSVCVQAQLRLVLWEHELIQSLLSGETLTPLIYPLLDRAG